MKSIFKWIPLPCALLLLGCSAVVIPAPIGEPVNLTGETEKWAGVWVGNGTETVTVEVVDAEQGILEVVGFFDKQTSITHITKYDQDLIASTIYPLDYETRVNKTNGFIWALLKKEEHMATMWVPNDDKFESLVKSGELPGRIEKSDVYLGELDENHLRMIFSKSNDWYFAWDSPGFYVRRE